MLNPFMDGNGIPSMGLKLSPSGIPTAGDTSHHPFHHHAHHHPHHNAAAQYHHHQIHQTNGYHTNPPMSYAAAHLLRSR